ncbi:group I intron-associated PD-(D/E)XK endonuclease [Exiguobacterium aestuarii]|uniref:Group I intron-associated PD-(D/E)XK endonuclease n=1 Tax=Exiguobacterium aestuarii TaxID=273527 RepID=A0ABW2PPB4_9BACL|nr:MULTISPECIES: group I intron-associated PD-(D/E)XK endonuclease [Exiguobacterium]MCT4784722.1 group I intron-associated PD-(D/E)XK endonuclease [Exiguobacterium aestuarii]MDE0563732.1 group I intron-associated PD-(D/E)XK endonuclease [Exiguobacterium sp. B2(2022)]
MYHHTKSKGDLGVLKAQVDLYQKGFMILFPATEHAPFDLVVYKDNQFKRIQVKYRELNTNGVLNVRFRSSYSTASGVQTRFINKDEIDVYCVYCPQTDTCYYFEPNLFEKSISLRVKTPKNNQKQNILFADDYREVP